MFGPTVDKFRVISDDMGQVWEAQEVAALDGQLPQHQVWLVFTPRRGDKRRIPFLQESLGLLPIEHLRWYLERAEKIDA